VPALRAAAEGTGIESIVLAAAHPPEARALADVVRATDAGASVA
jgi:hypothetical protein